MSGLRIVEGGPRVNTRTDFNTHALPFDFPNRQIPTMRPGKAGFDSERSRGVGGKTMLWNAVALRLSQRDFKGKAYDGAGEDWPLDYKDIAPVLRRHRTRSRRLRQPRRLEDLPDGEFLPPVPLKCSDEILRRAANRLADRLFTFARRRSPFVQDAPRLSLLRQLHGWLRCRRQVQLGRRPYQPCGKKPAVSPSSPTASSGKCDVDENRATGVRYLHRLHQQEGEVRGRTVVIACACVQSVALLMMSTSSRYPTGLANSSGQLGRNFIPHFTGGIECLLEGLRGKAATNDEGFLDHAYLPSFRHKDKKRGYARSFGAQLNYQNRRFAGWAKISRLRARYKAKVKAGYPRTSSLRRTARWCRTRSR